MATHSKQELKTVAVLFMDHPDDPDGVLEYVTPMVAEMLRRMEELDDAGRAACCTQRVTACSNTRPQRSKHGRRRNVTP